MADGNSGTGWGWLWLILVIALIGLIIEIALIGGAYLYQREGGKVFGPKGIFGPKGDSGPLEALEPPSVTGFKQGWDTGDLSHDLLLTNESAGELNDVDLTVKLYREDGQIVQEKRFWSTWKEGQTKRLNVPAHKYQKVEWQGTAQKGTGLWSHKVRIDSFWRMTWE